MTKLIVSLFALAAVSASADVASPVSKVTCKKVGVAREGGPDTAAANAWLKESERANGPSNGSVSVTFLGNSTYLVCRTYQVEER